MLTKIKQIPISIPLGGGPMTQFRCYIWVVFVIFSMFILMAAGFTDYKIIYHDSQFLMEAIFQIVGTDLNNDSADEFVVAGKNYTGREMFVYWLTPGNDMKPAIKWQSPNLYEDLSIIWVASGKLLSDKTQLFIFTNSQIYVYQAENETLNLVTQFKHGFRPLNINSNMICADVDGDGQVELIMARIGQINSKFYDGMVQAWKYRGDKFELVAESGLLQNVRGLTAGDIDGDGTSEIFVDEGIRTNPGDIHVLRYTTGKLKEIYSLRNATKTAAYAMDVKSMPEGLRLIAANGTRINAFAWSQNRLVPAEQLVLNYSLVALAAPDFNQDKIPEFVVGTYPQRLLILKR